MLRLGVAAQVKQADPGAPNENPSPRPVRPGVTSQLLYMICRSFMRRDADLPRFRYTSSCHAASCHAARILDEITISDRRRPRSPFRIPPILTLSISHTFACFPSPLISARRSARGSCRFLCRPPTRGAAERRKAPHWVFDHAGEARCRVGNTQPSRCDRDDAPRRSTVAISGRGTTLQLRQCSPDPRCDLPAGPIARPGRLGPVPPVPRFASAGHGTPRLAPSSGSSPETPLMSENESGVA
jgi:hypothetical protein